MRQRSLWRRAEKVPCVHTAVHIFGTPFFPIRLSALCRYSGVTQPCKTTTHLSRFFVRCVDVQSFIINPLQSNNNNYSQHNNMQQQQLWCDTAVHSIFLKKMCVQTQLSETACFHLEAHHHPVEEARRSWPASVPHFWPGAALVDGLPRRGRLVPGGLAEQRLARNTGTCRGERIRGRP